MNTLSVNGKDGSGKSQQIRLLYWNNKNIIHITRPLITYSSSWPKLYGYEMSQWWFERISVEKLVDIIIESLNYRHKDNIDGKLTINDRGWRMFKSVCAATTMTREQITLEEATAGVDKQFDKKIDHDLAETEILLKADQDYFSKIRHIVKFIRPPEDNGFPEESKKRYLAYQKNLSKAIDLYFSSENIYKIAVNEPIIDVQNKLREIITNQTGITLPRICDKLRLVVGMGGLSDCGKSSFADYLRKDYGFLRLKLRYFIESLIKEGKETTPEKTVLKVLGFLESLPYDQFVTVESLHDPYIPAMLKLLLGDRCRIVYLDTEKRTRIHRCSIETGLGLNEAERIINEKDDIKRGRGAEEVKNISDIVFDNSENQHLQNLKKFVTALNVQKIRENPS